MAATAKKKTSVLPVKRTAPLPKATKPAAPEAVRRALPHNDEDNGGSPVAGPENLDKVRDILFGSQMRDQDRRFARLEERLAKELTDVREENRVRLESLEAYAKKELQLLADRLKAESAQRTDAFKGVAQELKETAKGISEQQKAADDRAGESQRELREDSLAQAKALRDEITKAAQEADAATTRAADDLRSEKADKAALADLFTEIGLRINNDGPPTRRK